MLRSTIARSTRIMSLRFYTTSSEGATGSGFSRPGGQAAGDSFTKREKAAEDLYIRQQEKSKLKELRERLKAQREQLDKLDAHVEEMARGQGDEKK